MLQLLAGTSTHKFRAQQIHILTGKVKQLTAQLNASEPSTDGSLSNLAGPGRESIRKAETEKRRELDRLKSELSTLSMAHDATKRKHDGNLARLKSMEREAKENKTKMSVLISKVENDDKYIQALLNQIEQLKVTLFCPFTSEEMTAKSDAVDAQ